MLGRPERLASWTESVTHDHTETVDSITWSNMHGDKRFAIQPQRNLLPGPKFSGIRLSITSTRAPRIVEKSPSITCRSQYGVMKVFKAVRIVVPRCGACIGRFLLPRMFAYHVAYGCLNRCETSGIPQVSHINKCTSSKFIVCMYHIISYLPADTVSRWQCTQSASSRYTFSLSK